MRNFKKEDLIIGAKIYVYSHSDKLIKPVVIKSVEAHYYYDDYKNKFSHDGIIFSKPHAATVEFLLDDVKIAGPDKKGSFYVDFSEEDNKRGTDFTGFETLEYAKKFQKYLIEQEIKEKENEIKELKNKINSVE